MKHSVKNNPVARSKDTHGTPPPKGSSWFYVVQAGKNYQLPVFKFGHTSKALDEQLKRVQNENTEDIGLCFCALTTTHLIEQFDDYLRLCHFSGRKSLGKPGWYFCSGGEFMEFLTETYKMYHAMGKRALIPKGFTYLSGDAAA